jgi:hypothetical protein
VHLYFQQPELQQLHKRHGILTQTWSPVGGATFYRGGNKSTLEDPTRLEIGREHGPFGDPEVGQACSHCRKFQTGLAQHRGDTVHRIGPGDSVWIPPAVKHWHGATPTSGMEHLAIGESLNSKSFEWPEKVSDQQYVSSLAEKAPDAP